MLIKRESSPSINEWGKDAKLFEQLTRSEWSFTRARAISTISSIVMVRMTVRLVDRAADRFGLLLLISTHSMRVTWIRHSNRLGMLMLGVMLLGMDLFVLLEILGTFELLVANGAVVRFEGGVHCGYDDKRLYNVYRALPLEQISKWTRLRYLEDEK